MDVCVSKKMSHQVFEENDLYIYTYWSGVSTKVDGRFKEDGDNT